MSPAPFTDIAHEYLSAERERNLRREHHRLHPDLLTKSGRVCIVCLLLRRLTLERHDRKEQTP